MFCAKVKSFFHKTKLNTPTEMLQLMRPFSIGVGFMPFLPSVVGEIAVHIVGQSARPRSRNILGTYLASSEIRKHNQNNDLD
jgi:hypothetical protein